MFLEQPLTGRELPSRTLSLTFDDGPGIKTVELSRFLREEGVPATFFVVGEQAELRGDAIESLVHNSHTIGNHTYSHSGLCDLIDRGGDPVDELLKAERLIAAWAARRREAFSAPLWKLVPGSGRLAARTATGQSIERHSRPSALHRTRALGHFGRGLRILGDGPLSRRMLRCLSGGDRSGRPWNRLDARQFRKGIRPNEQSRLRDVRPLDSTAQIAGLSLHFSAGNTHDSQMRRRHCRRRVGSAYQVHRGADELQRVLAKSSPRSPDCLASERRSR